MKRWWIGVAGSLTLATGSLAAQPSEFSRAMEDVMARMHSAMMVAPTRSADHDFAKMMIAHHQGAIDMAEIELRFGKNERLRRLAQGIIVEQRQEISVMQGILDADHALPSRFKPSPTSHPHPGAHP